MSAAAALYSTLSYGQAYIHSDMATATLLAQTQIRHRSIFPESWYYVNGEVWVIGLNIFVMPFSVLMQNQSLARVLGSALLIVVTLAGMRVQSRKLFHDRSWMLSIPVFLLFLHGTGLRNGSADMILYQAAYTSAMLWMAVASTLAYSVFSGRAKKRQAACFAVLLMLLCMQGIRSVAEIVLPLGCAAVVILYLQYQDAVHIRDCRKGMRRAALVSAAIWVPSLAGLILYKWICVSCKVVVASINEVRYAESLKDCLDNAGDLIIALFENFGFIGKEELFSVLGIRNMISITACILIVFVIPVLQFRKLKEEREETIFFYIFGMIHNVIMYIMAVLCSKTVSRYMLTSVYVYVIISARYVMAYWLKPNNLRKCVYMVIFIASVIIQCYGIYEQGEGWAHTLKDKKDFAQNILEHGLHKGYATFWNAYTYEVYSDLQLRMGGVKVSKDGIQPYRWLVDSEVFQDENTNTFLLLSREENDMIRGHLCELYGRPLETYVVDDMYIYVFDHDLMVDVDM